MNKHTIKPRTSLHTRACSQILRVITWAQTTHTLAHKCMLAKFARAHLRTSNERGTLQIKWHALTTGNLRCERTCINKRLHATTCTSTHTIKAQKRTNKQTNKQMNTAYKTQGNTKKAMRTHWKTKSHPSTTMKNPPAQRAYGVWNVFKVPSTQSPSGRGL